MPTRTVDSRGSTGRTPSILPRLLPLNAVIFLGFMTVSLPLPVLPLFASATMDAGPPLIGLLVGIQSVVTVLTRPYAGRYADAHGSRATTLLGLWICAAAGALYVTAALLPAGLPILLAGRAVLGLGESLILTGAITWGIGRVGPGHSGQVMSWNGIAMYAALAAGAPLGLLTYHLFDDPSAGFVALGVLSALLPLSALVVAMRLHPVPVLQGARITLRPLLRTIWPFGLALTFLMASYGTIAAFYSLLFEEMGWVGAGLGFAGFGAAVIVTRLLFGGLPDRIGGKPVALVSMAVAFAGQVMIWLAPEPLVAIVGATLTGSGVALGFPSLGVEAMKRVPANSRGMMVAVFSAFQDLAFGLTGPLAGLLIVGLGTGSATAFALGTLAAVAAIAILSTVRRTPQK